MNDETRPDARRYAYLKAVAHFEGAWKSCPRAPCRRLRKCTGGPRGTCRRFGIPFCRRDADAQWWREVAVTPD